MAAVKTIRTQRRKTIDNNEFFKYCYTVASYEDPIRRVFTEICMILSPKFKPRLWRRVRFMH